MRPASLPNFFLPAQLTPLIDRTDELATIRQYLVEGNVRLLTLTGPAGVGKTRLALAAAAAGSVAVHFADGVIVIDLAPIREPSLVLPTIAQALGLIDTGYPPLDERLRTFLREREAVLVVLDNFEQVLPAGWATACGCWRQRRRTCRRGSRAWRRRSAGAMIS
jgi:Cdc6-like AAA superfamily ATPase